MTYIFVFLATLAALEALRRNAGRLGLISCPGAHRHHDRPTPLVGGLGIFIGIVLGIWFLPIPQEARLGILGAGMVLVGMGVWDDMREVSFAARFVAQAVAVALLAFIADVSLRHLGAIFISEHSLALGRWGVALTIVAAVGVINAVNMSDGLDGLAGGLSVVTCVALLIASVIAGNLDYVPLLGIAVAALAAFLLYNARIAGFRSARLYLGDAGSLFIGFLLAWFLIALTQGEQQVIRPVTALWVFALPLCDAVAALMRRPLQGRSPFHADRTHYHHYLRDFGLSVNQTVLVSVLLAAALAGVGLFCEYRNVPETAMFYGFLVLFAGYLCAMVYLDANIERLARRRIERQSAEHRGARDSGSVKPAR